MIYIPLKSLELHNFPLLQKKKNEPSVNPEVAK